MREINGFPFWKYNERGVQHEGVQILHLKLQALYKMNLSFYLKLDLLKNQCCDTAALWWSLAMFHHPYPTPPLQLQMEVNIQVLFVIERIGKHYGEQFDSRYQKP